MRLAEGGGEAGLDNYRTLCTPCHARETGKLKGRLKAAERRALNEKLGVPDIRGFFGKQQPQGGGGGGAGAGGDASSDDDDDGECAV